MANKDYYKILQVQPSAEPDIITAAYRRLAQKYHPDSKNGNASKSKMQKINEAYEILSDPENRKKYNQLCGINTDDNGDLLEEQESNFDVFHESIVESSELEGILYRQLEGMLIIVKEKYNLYQPPVEQIRGMTQIVLDLLNRPDTKLSNAESSLKDCIQQINKATKGNQYTWEYESAFSHVSGILQSFFPLYNHTFRKKS